MPNESIAFSVRLQSCCVALISAILVGQVDGNYTRHIMWRVTFVMYLQAVGRIALMSELRVEPWLPQDMEISLQQNVLVPDCISRNITASVNYRPQYSMQPCVMVSL